MYTCVMRIFLNLILLLKVLLISATTFGQHATPKCGTTFFYGLVNQAGGAHIPVVTANCQQIQKVNKKFQVSLHIGVSNLGFQNVTEENITEAFEKLNSDFSPIGFEFEVCLSEIMEDDRFDSLTVLPGNDEFVTMTSIYYEPNTINVYLVDSVETELGLVGGFAVGPGGLDAIVMDKTYINDEDDVFTHEMGHFFGLYHTFETEFGEETVDGANCETAGDLICDTGADPVPVPGPDPQADEDDLCNYRGPTFLDSNGDWYVPPTDNFMSYYQTECTCRFTIGQYNRMVDQYLTLRNYLW